MSALDLQPDTELTALPLEERVFVPGVTPECKLNARILRHIEELGALNDRANAIFVRKRICKKAARELAADYDAKGIHDMAWEIRDRAGIERTTVLRKAKTAHVD